MNLMEVFKAELSGLVAKDIVTTHDAFGYLAERYGLNQIPITGISTTARAFAKEDG